DSLVRKQVTQLDAEEYRIGQLLVRILPVQDATGRNDVVPIRQRGRHAFGDPAVKIGELRAPPADPLDTPFVREKDVPGGETIVSFGRGHANAGLFLETCDGAVVVTPVEAG